jgi:hypothetical protein
MSSANLPACDAPPAPGSLAEYESRRCAVCGAKYPCFGFGPPMNRPGVTLWTCPAHRQELENRIVCSSRPTASHEGQGTLL